MLRGGLVLLHGPAWVAASLGVGAALCAVRARRRFALSERNRVGADSEGQVARALRSLSVDGWKVRHGVDWPGPGAIDHVVRARGVAFAIETKTARYSPAHLERVRHQARWLAGRRRAAIPVLVLCARRRMHHYEGEVLVVSSDELVGALRRLERDVGRRAA